jgi:hypothetical protein
MTAPVARAADVVCDHHKTVIVATRLWPADYQVCPDCRLLSNALPAGGILLLPHLDTSRCVAVHEAGHAVTYTLLGVKVHYASMRPGDGVSYQVGGHVSLDLAPDEYVPVGLWGGTAAVRRLMLNAGTPTIEDLIDLGNNGYGDTIMLRKSGVSDVELRAARDRADEMAEHYWEAISRVADALLARGRLTGAEIVELVG